MSNVIIVGGANFSQNKIRKILLQDVEISTIHDGVILLNNSGTLQLAPTIAGTTFENDFPDMAPFEGLTIAGSVRNDADTCRFAQVEVPDGAIGLCGIASALISKSSATNTLNSTPIIQRKSDGTVITSDFGLSWVTQNNKTYSLTDAAFESVNLDRRMYTDIKVITSIDGVNPNHAYGARLINFTAKIHPDAKYIDLCWVAPKSITGKTATTPGNATLGVGQSKPIMKWIYE